MNPNLRWEVIGPFYILRTLLSGAVSVSKQVLAPLQGFLICVSKHALSSYNDFLRPTVLFFKIKFSFVFFQEKMILFPVMIINEMGIDEFKIQGFFLCTYVIEKSFWKCVS